VAAEQALPVRLLFKFTGMIAESAIDLHEMTPSAADETD
jgi:hypothetical protein